MPQTKVLFTQKNSVYNSLNCDCYDEVRNALTFSGSDSIIAHPPCRLWSRMRAFSTAPESEKELARFAVSIIQKNGGVLEHPAHSSLWADQSLPLPGARPDPKGGFTLDINLHWFGYPARKRTWLYVVGLPYNKVPVLPLSFDAITHIVGSSKYQRSASGTLKEISKSARSETPIGLAEWLIQVIHLIDLEKCL